MHRPPASLSTSSAREVGIRPATAEDREWLRTLHTAAYAVLSGQLYDERADAWQRGFFSARIAHPVDVFIVSKDGTDVGAVYLEDRPECVFVESMEVLPEHQGRGAGSGALRWLLGQAGQTGRAVALQVHKANTRAQSLYERVGFSVVGKTETHYKLQSGRAQRLDAAVRFRTPFRAEMAIRQRWLADPAFMAYNAGWNIDHASYHPDTGCVDFPPEAWDAWYDHWVGRRVREYWFVEDVTGQLVGHAHYHVEHEPDGRRVASIGAAIHPDHRRRGLGLATFAELVRRIEDTDVADVARNELDAGRAAAIRIHQTLGFQPGDASGELDPARPVTIWELPLR